MSSKNQVVLLVRPRGLQTKPWLKISDTSPIGLGYLASTLKKNGVHAKIIDLALKPNLQDDTLLSFIEKIKPLFVGITAMTNQYASMRTLSKLVKSRFHAIPVVLGGVHVTSLAEKSLEECEADIVVIGEGEKTVVELARYFSGELLNIRDINGIVFKEGNQIYRTARRPLIEDLDSIPIPDWNQINPLNNPKETAGSLLRHKKFAQILSTRGCPFNCSYCASCKFWQNKIRFRNPALVVDEIEYLNKQFGIREIQFWDDNLTLNREHIKGICTEIIKRRLNIAISTPNGLRVDTLDEEILKLMKRAGFYYLTLSVESGSRRILRLNDKFTDLKKIIKNALLAKKLGFVLNGFFMIGFPQETEQDIRKTLNLARSLPLDVRSIFSVKPLPGSRLFDEWMEEKGYDSIEWSRMHYMDYNDNTNLSRFPPRELNRLIFQAYRESNLNLKSIFSQFILRFIKFFNFAQFRWNLKKIHILLFAAAGQSSHAS